MATPEFGGGRSKKLGAGMGESALPEQEKENGLSYDLSFQDVIRILKVVQASPNCRQLDVQLGPLRVSLTRGGGAVSAGGVAMSDAGTREPAAAAETRDGPSAAGAAPASPDRPEIPDAAPGEVPVKSPVGGVFYRAPAPGEPPYVEVGSTVDAGDVLGLIEVMKLFTPVRAPAKGTVRAVHADNQEVVEAGRILMILAGAVE